jgi:hypothetical protein
VSELTSPLPEYWYNGAHENLRALGATAVQDFLHFCQDKRLVAVAGAVVGNQVKTVGEALKLIKPLPKLETPGYLGPYVVGEGESAVELRGLSVYVRKDFSEVS